MRYPSHILTPEQHKIKSAHRLKKLAPLAYRRAVRQGRLPKV